MQMECAAEEAWGLEDSRCLGNEFRGRDVRTRTGKIAED